MFQFSLTLENLTFKDDKDITLIYDGDKEIGKIEKKTDEKGTYYKGSFDANPHYKGNTSTEEEMSVSSAKIKLKIMYKKYKDSLNAYADETDGSKEEYEDLLSKLDDDGRTKANEFLKSLSAEDHNSLIKTINYIKKNLKLKEETK